MKWMMAVIGLTLAAAYSALFLFWMLRLSGVFR